MESPRPYVNRAAAMIALRIPHCKHREGYALEAYLLQDCFHLEDNLKRPLIYTSGYRCPACNRAIGGVENSEHLQGLAVDISVQDSRERYQIIRAALRYGVRRIGVGDTYIHIGVGGAWPQNVIWLYPLRTSLPPIPGIRN